MVRYNEWAMNLFLKGFGRPVEGSTRVLDFGAGLGTLSKIFYRKTGVKPDAVEIDPNQRSETARQGFPTYASLADAPSGYDLIFTSNVLEHIEDDEGVLKTLRERLKNNGILLIYVPAFEFLWTSMDDKVGHVRRYHRKDLRDRLQKAGYEILHISYRDSLGFFLSILFKFIGSKQGNLPLRSLYIYDRFLLPISRIIDVALSRFFGKNLFVVARKN
ncbi:MAG: class I SAM-dependent methyltransferase [Alphaproteobacteria bacterium]|nr:class I SAM-dependent methyltransferase [Alphaproteobacteria bacterium]